jgi:hypothetical protein
MAGSTDPANSGPTVIFRFGASRAVRAAQAEGPCGAMMCDTQASAAAVHAATDGRAARRGCPPSGRLRHLRRQVDVDKIVLAGCYQVVCSVLNA